MKQPALLFLALSLACGLRAETVVSRQFVVQVSEDGASTIPPNTIATPLMVSAAEDSAQTAFDNATNAAALAGSALERTTLYGTNYVVTSTVYVQSVGGVPYDPSNQTIRVHNFSASATNVVIVGTVRQVPLVPPSVDWRVALDAGAWSNVSATVAQTAVPPGVTNAAAAYTFTLARPAGGSGFFRVVDNSTGASGSGLYWVVFGAIFIDGHRGWTGALTNIVGGVTNTWPVRGGIVTEADPLGGF